MNTTSLIGQPIDRTDGRLKVTGGARYAAEINLPGLVHGVMVSSTVSSGTIAGIDTAAAEKSPGVLAVFTHLNMPKLPPPKPGPHSPIARKLSLLQDDAVYHELQPIGVVVADTLEHATHAAALVKVDYAPQPLRIGLDQHKNEAYKPGTIGGHEEKPDTAETENAAAIAGAAAHFEQLYVTPTETHAAMEPHATIAVWDGPRLTVYDATQGVHSTKGRLAQLFQIPKTDVRVICHYVGGGFGSKGPVWSHTALAAMCARQVGKPVKINVTRRQCFNNTGSRPETHQTVGFGAAADGTLAALKHTGLMHTSVFDEFTEPVASASRMLYASPNIYTGHRLVRLNLGTPSFMRAPGEASGTFALESALDELAYQLKMDPIELRLKNYAETDPEKKLPFSSKSLRECYAEGAKRFGWDKWRASREPRSVKDGRWLVGYGMASATYPMNRSAANAYARINADGTALVQAGTQDLGTGTWTVMAQIAAETLGLTMDKVRFELGDTALPETPVSGGSQTAASTGSAVKVACDELCKRFAEKGKTDDESYAAFLTRAKLPFIEQKGESEPERERKFSTHSFGAQFAEVRVDPDTGEVRVSRWTGAFGVGKRLNEKTAVSQLKGGIVFGIGMALMEHTIADDRDARLINPNLAEYHVPVNADVPEIDVHFVDEEDTYINPLGIKGIGEIGITGVPAAIANAVYHATGVRVRDLPITPDKVLLG